MIFWASFICSKKEGPEQLQPILPHMSAGVIP
jgi:hypothetical protein